METITMNEVIAMLILVSDLDPNDYPTPKAKSTIYRAKGVVESANAGSPDGVALRVVK